MVCLDDDDLVDRCLLLRRWGRRSEAQLYGSRKGVDRRFFSSIDGDLEYDNLFIFDEVGWNFEPSELSAAFGLVQLDKLADNLARRKHNFARLTRAVRAAARRVRAARARTDGVDTAWHMFPVLHPARVGRRSAARSSSTWNATASTRAWCGPATRCASPRSRASRTARRRTACPNADRVMEHGLILPSNHSLTDDDIDYIWATAEAFVS